MSKKRSFGVMLVLALGLLATFPAGATCWTCEYIWFVGHECTPHTESVSGGEDACSNTNGCRLVGGPCTGGSCGDGQGGCEPENQGLRIGEGDAVLTLADADLFSDGEAHPIQRCFYTID